MGRGRLVGEKPKLSRMERSIVGNEAKRGQQLKSQPEWMESKVGIGRIKRFEDSLSKNNTGPASASTGSRAATGLELL